ncbi:MAG: sensor histidine kinase [Armatimonadota bacterium]
MSRILLLIDQPEDRRLLAESLAEHEVVIPESDDVIDAPHDLCIVDGPTLARVWHRLQAHKRAEAPLFCPVLLVTSRQDVGTINPEIWTVVEELLLTPVQKAELHTRVSMLVRMRRMSLELERRRQELFRTLVEDSLIGVYLLTDGRFTYINQAGADIFGYQADDVIDHLELLDLVHAEDRPALVEMLRQHRAGERDTIQVTVRGVRKDGGIVACDIYGRQSRYLDHPALMGQLVNVTERVEADRAKNQFLAVLSHELRTPLTNILGWVQEAQEIPEIIPQALRIIERNAESQSRMLENLLVVSRLIHGKLTLKLVPADLWEITLQTLETMQKSVEEHQLTVILEPPGHPLPITADVKRLQHVIVNLLDNACAFTDPGGTVTLRGRREDDQAVLTVCDTGRGIPAEQLPTLYTLFSSPSATEATGGLHLGLPLVKHLVELHGGHVAAESPGVGQGSTFTITLPLRETSPEA